MEKIQVNHHEDSYYVVNGQKTFSKTRAIELSSGDTSKINFKWMENTWDNAVWHVEPKQTWQELVKTRCQQIREKYLHVSLWYSGGYDSHTILKTFVDNNILLDELVIINRTTLYDDPEYKFAIKHATTIKNNYFPNIKINIIPLDYTGMLSFYRNMGDDWIYHIGSTIRFNKTTKYYLTNYHESIIKNLNKYDTRADIMGHEKAKVYLHDNKWYCFFVDANLSDTVGSKQESFYISEDLPELYVKQAWNVTKWFENLPEFSPELVHSIQGKDMTKNGPYTKYYAAWNMAMGRYPLYHSHISSTTGTQKFLHTNDVNSPDSLKLLNYAKDNEPMVYSTYMNGIENIKKINTGPELNPTMISKPYFVKNFEKRF
jgi:hypothetical protein